MRSSCLAAAHDVRERYRSILQQDITLSHVSCDATFDCAYPVAELIEWQLVWAMHQVAIRQGPTGQTAGLHAAA